MHQVYETLTGVKVDAKLHVLKKEDTLKSLPPEWPVDPTEDIRKLNQNGPKTLVVLDDDPTGTQTVHEVEVLTEWLVFYWLQEIFSSVRKGSDKFYLLPFSGQLSHW